MRNYLRSRYGHELPDDDAGRQDLFELLLPISVGPNAELKMPKAIEIWAPWMNSGEAAELIDRISCMPIYKRKPTAGELGDRLNVTNAQRNKWRMWTIAPCDMTAEQLVAQRKAKDRERKRLQRERQPRAQWLANSISRKKPWLVLGIKSKRSYYRHLAKKQNGTGVSALKLSTTTSDIPVPRKRHRRKRVADASTALRQRTPTKPERARRQRRRTADAATAREFSGHTCATVERHARQWLAMWQAEGRSLTDYKAGLQDQDSEVWKWRRAKGRRGNN
jgi:hypothetical protein